MRKTLLAEFPIEITWRQRLHNGAFLAFAITVLVAIFVVRPQRVPLPDALWIGFQFGVVTFVGYFVNEWLEEQIQRRMRVWRVWHELLGIGAGFLLIGIANYLAAILYGYLDHRWANFWHMQSLTVVVGFLPVLLLNVVGIHRRLQRRLREAERMNQRPAAPPPTVVPKEIPVQLPGTELRFLPSQFCFAESERNYLHLHLHQNEKRHRETLRMTMTAFAAATTDRPEFFRCHRAFVVNPKRVTHVAGNAQGYRLTVRGTEVEVPVSRSRVRAFREEIADEGGK